MNNSSRPADRPLSEPRERHVSLGPIRQAGTARLQALEGWLAEQIEIEAKEVCLPRSGRRYAIHVPSERSRQRLVEAAQADPEKPMPHWARIWGSGVAMADIAIAHRDQLAGQRVLELGCGMGTTATAVVEAGARLLVSDYSEIPLALCRYNALKNTGRSPNALRLNWRSPDRSSMERLRAGGRFPFILAADVLYESRDIHPLFALVDELLAPDGMLWLAEPGRRTAQRFLNIAAEAGWQGESLHIFGDWPDGSSDVVYIHFLRRGRDVDSLAATLGGWRT